MLGGKLVACTRCFALQRGWEKALWSWVGVTWTWYNGGLMDKYVQVQCDDGGSPVRGVISIIS